MHLTSRCHGICVLVAALASSACTHPGAQAANTVTLRLATGPIGSGYNAFGQAIAAALSQNNAGIRLDVQTSVGAIANVDLLQGGKADVAFTYNNVAYRAFNGNRRHAFRPLDQLRAVGVVQLTPVQVVAGPHTSVRSIRDLRGLRVSIGPAGTGTADMADTILRAFDVDPLSVHTEALRSRDASPRLVSGQLDAMFDATYSDAIAAALGAGARLIPITGPPVSRLRRANPFLRMMVLPGPSRPTAAGDDSAANPVQTLGLDTLLLCQSSLDEEVVHSFTVALFEALETLRQIPRWNIAGPDQAPAAPIPLHEGAARYYREQELER